MHREGQRANQGGLAEGSTPSKQDPEPTGEQGPKAERLLRSGGARRADVLPSTLFGGWERPLSADTAQEIIEQGGEACVPPWTQGSAG